MISTDDRLYWYQEGEKAYTNGKRVSEYPTTASSYQRRDWKRGWNNAKWEKDSQDMQDQEREEARVVKAKFCEVLSEHLKLEYNHVSGYLWLSWVDGEDKTEISMINIKGVQTR